eukprot:3888398-Rhodomonas_salina.2
MAMPGGLSELVDELRAQRDGKDCVFNVVLHVAEARGLRGLAPHGLNDVKVRVHMSNEPIEKGKISKIHHKTSTPFFDWVAKLSFKGQPLAFFKSFLILEVLHDRGALNEKLVGLLQIGILDIYLSRDHKFPMQWYTIVDLESEEPAVATGYVRLSVIINTMDESGAAIEQVPEEERARCELMEIPRQHNYLTATGSYNIIFKVYQGSDLRAMDGRWNTADTYIKITTPTGMNFTDTRWSDLNPTYNQQLQIPLFEPMFRNTILVELWASQGLSDSLVATIPMSWKDIFCNQEYYNLPRWYDLFSLPDAGTAEQIADGFELAINKVHQWTAKAASSAVPEYDAFMSTFKRSRGGQYQEASVYCGRLLFSVHVEDREGGTKLPSLAQTDMKPKDCHLFKDTKHTMMFRLQIFHGQGLKVPVDGKAEVEVQIGNKTVVSSRVGIGGDLCQWYQAIELELDVPYDQNMWPWTDDDYEDGWFPADIIDHALPPVWIRVFRTGPSTALKNIVGGTVSGRQLIGFSKCTLV